MTKENILYKTNRHPYLFLIQVIKWILPIIVLGIIGFYIFDSLLILGVSILLAVILIIINKKIFWYNSYFYITNKKIALKVRNGFFSEYEMNLYFNQIKDMAYSKNNVLNYLLNCGTFFARSSGAEDDSGFTVNFIPDIENVFSIISQLYSLPQEKREKINKIEDLFDKKTILTKDEIIKTELEHLLSLKGIIDGYVLSDNDKRFVFENEEDRNHGVYETIKREVVYCITHDELFRDPDAPIVFKYGNKVIFPAIGFHEINRKMIVSSSPGINVHEYLIKKLKLFRKDDATLLIGFDLN
ncbi:MAG: hypothetical protein PHZ26_05535 [Candidatus Gracilibacteria bacterium]|nr:hypothetical protein [Candidatus Gracilibacteria bacterium]MDD2909178.1 hypothetical protein [Candidatus Gracilibacteria bacterium]